MTLRAAESSDGGGRVAVLPGKVRRVLVAQEAKGAAETAWESAVLVTAAAARAKVAVPREVAAATKVKVAEERVAAVRETAGATPAEAAAVCKEVPKVMEMAAVGLTAL